MRVNRRSLEARLMSVKDLYRINMASSNWRKRHSQDAGLQVYKCVLIRVQSASEKGSGNSSTGTDSYERDRRFKYKSVH